MPPELFASLLTILGLTSPWYFVNQNFRILEKIRLLAKHHGEAISPYYGCRGSTQHVQFGKQYAPEDLKKLTRNDLCAVTSFLLPLLIAVFIFSHF